MKYYAYIALLLTALSTGGCFRSVGPNVPATLPGERAALAVLDDPQDQGRLQIICCYSPPLFSHAALRLVCPDRPAIFWDPGGDFAKDRGPGGRIRDLIANPPTLTQYLAFREKIDDAGGEIFEWDIPHFVALRLYDVLTSGNSAENPGGAFTTSAVGLQCAMSISDFLDRFAPDVLTCRESYFYPYSLAQHLWTQNPSRILVYRRAQPLMIYSAIPSSHRTPVP